MQFSPETFKALSPDGTVDIELSLGLYYCDLHKQYLILDPGPDNSVVMCPKVGGLKDLSQTLHELRVIEVKKLTFTVDPQKVEAPRIQEA